MIYLGIDTVRNLAIISNAGALRQILANLLKNAAEALDSGGKVWIRSEYLQCSRQTGADSIRITIEDNDPGISPRLAKTVFSAEVTGKGKGHRGRGLAIARKLVMKLGGLIACSSHEGEGTCFKPCNKKLTFLYNSRISLYISDFKQMLLK